VLPLAEVLRRARIGDLDLAPPPYVTPATPVEEVLRLLVSSTRPAVLVRDGDRLAGVFTQRDVLYRTAGGALDPAALVGELASRDPRTLGLDQSLADALDLMVEGGYRQVPLVDAGGRPAGLLSSRDLLAFVAGLYPEATLNLPPRLHQALPTDHGA
jgi:CBS domain-containing protein